MTERENFLAEVLHVWTSAIAEVSNDIIPISQTWRGVSQIFSTLQPFMGENINHAHLPSGGGMDMRSIGYSHESNCLECGIGEHSIWVVKPASLTLEYIPESPINSFLLLELAALQPSGVYDKEEGDDERFSERLLELTQGEYVDQCVWEQGYSDHDENGYEIPLPSNSRLATRWLKGKILIVAKGSLWNGTSATYDGRHTEMAALDIRTIITETLNRINGYTLSHD